LQTSIQAIPQKNQIQGGAFSAEEIGQIRAAIAEKYAAVSSSASGFFKYSVGKEGALLLGYPEKLLDTIPDAFFNAFCGVGNPLAIEPVAKGSAILDIGCGAGLDLLVASSMVGATGRVVGIDLSGDMVARARANLEALQLKNVSVFPAASETLPFPPQSFDKVISNGAINLSPDKPQLFTEIYRVLKPGGKLQFADIILERELPLELTTDLDSWSN
jgi:arsenite methyltransferase